MRYPKQLKAVLVLVIIFLSNHLIAQPTWTLDPFGKEQKPEQYEEKKLPSEKTGDKKFNSFRRFLQNNTTRYNYYFNATNKIAQVLERAKLSQQDDYTKLLSFYPYSLDATAAQKVELDSVIYKATGGILLHDLRSDWVDNMYLLMGQAYFYRKDFDSAALTFQFINYNLFPRKKNEDDSRTVGSNENGSMFSIANSEKQGFLQKITGLPPSRNDALIWMIRTLIESEQYGDAAGLMNILSEDANLPKRLKNDLEEMKAYYFYRQEIYDSSAKHLENALSAAETKQDKSRWEFLLAQMSEMNGDFNKASEYYAAASKHTVDPMMDIYAKLNDAKMDRDEGNVRELEKSIARLLKMAKKDRFDNYRDIIYYSVAQLSLEKPDTVSGKNYYAKSVKYNSANPSYRNKAFLQLANIAYIEKKYAVASNYYDSLALDDPSLKNEVAMITARKNTLNNVVAQIKIIERQDSLQRIAGMAPADRDAYIKKLVRQARKSQGLKEEDNSAGNTLITFSNNKDEPIDLFAAPSKGEWYFYNTQLKSRGYNDFKAKWGKRDNIDNWRRKSAAANTNLNPNINIDDPLNPGNQFLGQDKNKIPDAGTQPLTYEAFMEDLPLSQEKMDSSNATIAKSLLTLAKLFQNELEDYHEAIRNYEEYMLRFPGDGADGEVYLGLYYCYSRLGNSEKAEYFKNLVVTKHPGTNAAKAITNPASLHPEQNNPEAMARYGQIYNMFIEGDFQQAAEEKRKADSVYGKNYWTPQLLYIEAIGYVKDRQDSIAIAVLNNIIQLYPASPLKAKAETLVSVLKRRSEIESYLTNLQVTRAEDEDKILINEGADKPVTQKSTEPAAAPKIITPGIKPPVIASDTIRLPESMVSGNFVWQADIPHVIVMVLNKVDAVYINEAKNAMTRYNREKFPSRQIMLNRENFNAEQQWIIFEKFADANDAIAFYDKLKRDAPGELSWLPANKYSFFVISTTNLDKLRENKDTQAYKALLEKQYPGKF
jgi:tetratricopeptide (TPR) repeat protein